MRVILRDFLYVVLPAGLASASGNCSAPKGEEFCLPRNGDCGCNRLALEYELTGPAGAAWKQRFPALVASLDDPLCSNATKKFVPCYTSVADNTWCNCTSFTGGLRNSTLELWGATVARNSEGCVDPGVALPLSRSSVGPPPPTKNTLFRPGDADADYIQL